MANGHCIGYRQVTWAAAASVAGHETTAEAVATAVALSCLQRRELARGPADFKEVRLPTVRNVVRAAALPSARAGDELLAVLIAVDEVLEGLGRRVLGSGAAPN